MTIVASSFVVGHPQVDGRCYVREQHVDHLGVVHEREYGPVPDGVDYAAICAAYAARLDGVLAEREFETRLGRVAPLGLQHQTAAQFAARLRGRYRSA